MSNPNEYLIGDGSYGKVEVLQSSDLKFDGSTTGPKPYAPYLNIVKNNAIDCVELHGVIFIPNGCSLDAKKPFVGDFMGSEFFLFVNFQTENEPGPVDQLITFKATFTSEFSIRLRRKQIFVIPVHGDPEEGEVSKTTVQDEDEVD